MCTRVGRLWRRTHSAGTHACMHVYIVSRFTPAVACRPVLSDCLVVSSLLVVSVPLLLCCRRHHRRLFLPMSSQLATIIHDTTTLGHQHALVIFANFWQICVYVCVCMCVWESLYIRFRGHGIVEVRICMQSNVLKASGAVRVVNTLLQNVRPGVGVHSINIYADDQAHVGLSMCGIRTGRNKIRLPPSRARANVSNKKGSFWKWLSVQLNSYGVSAVFNAILPKQTNKNFMLNVCYLP